MFRGSSAVTIDVKGRLAVPARFREVLSAAGTDILVLTRSPWDRCIWAYPLPEWDAISRKLNDLPSGDLGSSETKRMMLALASDTQLDAQGRVLVPQEFREMANIDRRTMVLGQGNKLEFWDEAAWLRRRDAWLQELASASSPTSSVLASLSL